MPLTPEGATTETVATAFYREHERLYGFSLPGHPHEVLAVRAAAVGPSTGTDRPVLRREPRPRGTAKPRETRPMYDDASGLLVDGSVYAWDDLPCGSELEGPAVVEGLDATVWVPPGTRAALDSDGNLLLHLAV